MTDVRYTVIGAGGFIGSRVVAALAEQGVAAFTPARDNEDWLAEDLGRVFYCAGMTGDYRQRPYDTVEAHVSLLRRVLERGRFERIVFLSSTRLYGLEGGQAAREDQTLALDPNNAQHIYELTKALGENLTLNWSNGRGAVARLAYVFDWTPGAEGFLSDLLRQAEQSRDLVIQSNPRTGRDYVHVDDVVRALRAILDSGATGIVNVASGEVATNQALAEVFTRCGWNVTLDTAAAASLTPPLDVARLNALGVLPPSAISIVEARLRTLASR